MSGYDNFFKAAKTAKQPEAGPKKAARPQPVNQAPAKPKEQGKARSEAELRKMFKMAPEKQKRKKQPSGTPWMSMALSMVALSLSAYYLIEPEFFENLFSKIEIRATAMAGAAEDGEKSAQSKAEKTENTSPDEKSSTASAGAPEGTQDLSYFSKLTERNKELDEREKDLNELEEELHRQRAEVEVQIKRLEEMRRQIASVLNERVEIDEEKVNRLVEVYSSMKPKQAADIIATLNEDLAVEVLGRMKKKDAAGILNLIEAKKAQTLSEKYTGYKSR